jgi:lysophospholipase L1-like esterase
MIKRICIFGASIAFGSGDFKFGGWQNHLKIWFAKQGKFQHVFNLAISGRTTDDIIKRFKNELLVRKSAVLDNEILAIVAIPSNDTRFVVVNKKREFEIPIEHFQNNLKQLKKLGKKYADKFIFTGITKVVDKKTNPWIVSNGGYCWENKVIEKYNQVAEGFCKENNIPFCPMFDVLEDEDSDDGLHPNADGHRKMFERIRDFLEEEKIIGK